jgi:Hemerythrin HHE cation binding domain
MIDDMTWDESTRPTLDEPPDASYSDVQLAPVRHLVDIHDHLRGELERLRDLLRQVRRGLLTVGEARAGVNEMTLRQNNWTLGAYCQSYCGFVNGHHGLEDASVFPHLRLAEPAVVPVVERLHAEHRVIHGLLDEVDRSLVALVRDGDTSALDALEESVEVLAGRLLSHLAYEERELLGPLARHGFF